METIYTNKQRKALFDRINNLSSTEHEEILKIVKKSNVKYSQNKNGIFFNLSNLPDDSVKEIDDFVHYCMSNKKDLDEYDKIINECKMSNNIKSIVPQSTTCSTLNTSLSNMGKSDTGQQNPTSKLKSNATWLSNIDETTVEKFVKFANKLEAEKDKIGRKKMNVKFNNAKKRFAKKCSDKKIDGDLNDVLKEDTYLL